MFLDNIPVCVFVTFITYNGLTFGKEKYAYSFKPGCCCRTKYSREKHPDENKRQRSLEHKPLNVDLIILE